MVGALNAVNSFRNIIRKQLVNPAIKIRVVLTAGGQCFQFECCVSPQEFMPAVFVYEAYYPSADARSDIYLQEVRLEADQLNAITVEVVLNSGHNCMERGRPRPRVLNGR